MGELLADRLPHVMEALFGLWPAADQAKGQPFVGLEILLKQHAPAFCCSGNSKLAWLSSRTPRIRGTSTTYAFANNDGANKPAGPAPMPVVFLAFGPTVTCIIIILVKRGISLFF
ncbi:hypothetical protein PoMZ_10804 [Pyricularia oryzae]|uniref:Uncharacterized protein n=1 Tax=Pyricularia oryzae TaxID=318829 RepID=A0A4P7MYG9_PYROR|nr:hypothetical protein PoMZ_10804 [Pyricularia oryzae]